MTCLNCNAHPKKLCPVHALTSNHDTAEDLELEEIRRQRDRARELLANTEQVAEQRRVEIERLDGELHEARVARDVARNDRIGRNCALAAQLEEARAAMRKALELHPVECLSENEFNRPCDCESVTTLKLALSISTPVKPKEAKIPCERCDGCGRIADSEDGEPWTVWEQLPPGSDVAVRMGIVKPIPCPDCTPGGVG